MGASPGGARTAAIALILAAGAFAQPRASLPQASFDFGQVVRGSRIQRDFVLKNLGDAPLRIERVVQKQVDRAAVRAVQLEGVQDESQRRRGS